MVIFFWTARLTPSISLTCVLAHLKTYVLSKLMYDLWYTIMSKIVSFVNFHYVPSHDVDEMYANPCQHSWLFFQLQLPWPSTLHLVRTVCDRMKILNRLLFHSFIRWRRTQIHRSVCRLFSLFHQKHCGHPCLCCPKFPLFDYLQLLWRQLIFFWWYIYPQTHLHHNFIFIL